MGIGYETYADFIERLLGDLRSSLGEEAILACALFGSVARGEAKEYSDIDLLVIHKKIECDPVKKFVEVLLALRKQKEYVQLVEKKIYPEPSIVFATPQEITQRPFILLDIMDHGKILLDKEGYLAQKLRQLRQQLTQMGAEKIALKDGSWAWDLNPGWKPGEVIEIIL